MRYQDLGADYYERQRDVRLQIAHHVGKLGALGFEVTLCRTPEPQPDGNRPDPGRLTIPPRRPRLRPQPPGPAAARPAEVLFSGQRRLPRGPAAADALKMRPGTCSPPASWARDKL